MRRSGLDLTTAGLLEPGMVMWWHGDVRSITAVQVLPPSESTPWSAVAITFDGYPRQALVHHAALVDAAWPAEAVAS